MLSILSIYLIYVFTILKQNSQTVTGIHIKSGPRGPVSELDLCQSCHTYAEDALLEWPNGGWGGAGPAGWESNMQHGSEPDEHYDKNL